MLFFHRSLLCNAVAVLQKRIPVSVALAPFKTMPKRIFYLGKHPSFYQSTNLPIWAPESRNQGKTNTCLTRCVSSSCCLPLRVMLSLFAVKICICFSCDPPPPFGRVPALSRRVALLFVLLLLFVSPSIPHATLLPKGLWTWMKGSLAANSECILGDLVRCREYTCIYLVIVHS